MAYDKYQERKARKVTASGQPLKLPEPEVRSSLAHGEILEKAPIDPPSYNELIVNRAIVPEPKVNVDEKAFDWTTAKDVTDDIAKSFDEERMYGVANGMNHSNVPMNAQPSRKGGCHSKCQQKKAEKAARKAEKWAAKAAARELRM